MADSAARIHDNVIPDNPFALENDTAYRVWRRQKLARFPTAPHPVRIQDLNRLTAAEHRAITDRCVATNLVIYSCAESVSKKALHRFGAQLGLTRLDANLCADQNAISSVEINRDALRKRYIPYTDKALNWHTDGYYNPAGNTIKSFILHCVRDAVEGGENAFLDPEIVYIRLRDANPDHILALMQPDVMTIPPNAMEDGKLRPAQSGPVFAIDPNGALLMRFTARSKSIVWKDEKRVQRAREALHDLLRESPQVVRYRLPPGHGVVSNNVLHSRSAFRNQPPKTRLLYRARYYDRVGTRQDG
ncbi:MAG: TauD/TfdA family dioxygenase [Gammaproteobacteria bacterium]|nr:TauD/TfdA family dioxygenase [Gammaproteobacteria bacterium]